MGTVIQATHFHESLIFDLVERLLEFGLTLEGEDFPLDPKVIGLLRRVAETTEGLPSQAVQEDYQKVFLRDLWEKLPPHERRAGMTRQFTSERRELTSLAE